MLRVWAFFLKKNAQHVSVCHLFLPNSSETQNGRRALPRPFGNGFGHHHLASVKRQYAMWPVEFFRIVQRCHVKWPKFVNPASTSTPQHQHTWGIARNKLTHFRTRVSVRFRLFGVRGTLCWHAPGCGNCAAADSICHVWRAQSRFLTLHHLSCHGVQRGAFAFGPKTVYVCACGGVCV